jgi:hypothetical protein
LLEDEEGLMDAYSFDKSVCKCGRKLSGVDRQSAGSQDSVRDRCGGRELSFSSTPGPGSSGGNSAGFFQSIDEGPHRSLISPRNASLQSDVDQGHEEPAYPPVP